MLMLSACVGSGPTPLPGNQITATFPSGDIANQIVVTAIDRLPLRNAELIAPDGHATAAQSITATPAPTTTFSQQTPALLNPGLGYGVGSIGSNALAPNVVGAAPLTQGRLLATVSTATIALPDPLAYRRDWQHYRIRLKLGNPPQQENREIAAPAPPAAG